MILLGRSEHTVKAGIFRTDAMAELGRLVFSIPFHTVDGRNPAPPGMVKTL